MKVVIIEDEPPAREKLVKFILRYDTQIEILAQFESIRETSGYFVKNASPDLVFADIELLDGNIFSVFEVCSITCPIIFTTAYDEFLLPAFEQNGIAYLYHAANHQLKIDRGVPAYADRQAEQMPGHSPGICLLRDS